MRCKRRCLFLLALCGCCALAAEGQPAAARTLAIRKDGSGQFTSIQAFADAAKPGDVGVVQEGVYAERVAVKQSGTPKRPIVFKAQGKVVMQGFDVAKQDHIVIDGFEITPGQPKQDGIAIVSSRGSRILNNHIHHTTGDNRAQGCGIMESDTRDLQIERNHIHHTAGAGIRLSRPAPSERTLVKGNTISFPGFGNGSTTAIAMGKGTHLLVEENDLSHVGDFVISWGGDFHVIRNNVFRDVLESDWDNGPHVDGVQGCSSHILIEGNRMYNVHEKGLNVHFALFEADTKQGVFPSNVTLRYNVVNGIDSCFLAVQGGYKQARAYHNTVVRTNGSARAHKNSAAVAIWHGGSGVVLNNLFCHASGSARNLYLTDKTLTPETWFDYNLAYHGATEGGWNPEYPVPEGTDRHGVRDKDPLFAAYSDDGDAMNDDLALQDASPAREAGGPLTTLAADAGKEVALKVADAGFFQAGWAGVQPDWIAVGEAENAAQLAAIDYATQTLTLAAPLPKEAKAGAPVWLFKKSDGARVLYGARPDIGAFEWGSPPPAKP
ncbi:MAG: right-handed parallel beta-helix repeat-containing protein [Planctomycetota bacterium]|nr:right-handed parallel beta-helix repeat-containing protein [Planctomycetota bacterium]